MSCRLLYWVTRRLWLIDRFSRSIEVVTWRMWAIVMFYRLLVVVHICICYLCTRLCGLVYIFTVIDWRREPLEGEAQSVFWMVRFWRCEVWRGIYRWIGTGWAPLRGLGSAYATDPLLPTLVYRFDQAGFVDRLLPTLVYRNGICFNGAPNGNRSTCI